MINASRVARRRLVTLVVAAAVGLACLMPAVALGRAGGGHVSSHSSHSSSHSSSSHSSFHSSGGSHSSSSHIGGIGSRYGSSGSGDGTGTAGPVSPAVFWICASLPICIGVFVVLGVVLVIRKVLKGRSAGDGAMASGRADGQLAAATAEGATGTPPVDFGVITAHDPEFTLRDFEGRVNEMFLAIQSAWQARNMEPARRFLSDQQFSVLSDGVGEYVRNGQINKLDGMHIDSMEPLQVSSEGGFETIKMAITATSLDYTIDERTGAIVNPEVLGDGKTPSTFTEFWTFIRKNTVATKAEATIAKCPNCGAPVTDGNYVKCAYCGTMMNDPTLDWVLLRIEQEE